MGAPTWGPLTPGIQAPVLHQQVANTSSKYFSNFFHGSSRFCCSWDKLFLARVVPGFPSGRCGLIQSVCKKTHFLWCRRSCGCGCGAEEEDALTITKLCSLLSPTRWQESQPGIPKCDWHWWHQPQMSRVHTPGPHQSPNLQHHQDKDQSPNFQTSPKSK